MRLLQTLRVPEGLVQLFVNPTTRYMGEVSFSWAVSPQLKFSTDNAVSGPVDFYLGQPRLGRVWNIERMVVYPDQVLQSATAASRQLLFAYNFQLLLNDVPVSDTESLVYTATNHALGLRDVTQENGPLNTQPFNPFEVNSGDILKCRLTAGTDTDLIFPESFGTWCKLRLQLLGSDEAKVYSR